MAQRDTPRGHAPRRHAPRRHAPRRDQTTRDIEGCNEAQSSVSESGRDSAERKITRSEKETKSINFDEVYGDGNPKHRHMIVEFPKGSHKWFILRCDEHRHFRSRPIFGAVIHLKEQHGYREVDHTRAIDLLGIRVLGCTTKKAKKNNVMFHKAMCEGYEPFFVANAFHCSDCNGKFSRNDHLTRHRITVHDDATMRGSGVGLHNISDPGRKEDEGPASIDSDTGSPSGGPTTASTVMQGLYADSDRLETPDEEPADSRENSSSAALTRRHDEQRAALRATMDAELRDYEDETKRIILQAVNGPNFDLGVLIAKLMLRENYARALKDSTARKIDRAYRSFSNNVKDLEDELARHLPTRLSLPNAAPARSGQVQPMQMHASTNGT